VRTADIEAARGDDELAAVDDRDAVLGAELLDGARSANAEFGLQRPRLVVHAGVDHPAVVAGLVPGRAELLLQHHDGSPGAGAQQRHRRRHADNAGSHDAEVVDHVPSKPVGGEA
jgi:hypothetical protein